MTAVGVMAVVDVIASVGVMPVVDVIVPVDVIAPDADGVSVAVAPVPAVGVSPPQAVSTIEKISTSAHSNANLFRRNILSS